MIRPIAIALLLLAVAGCAGGSESTEDTAGASESIPTTVLDATAPSGPVATAPQSNVASLPVESLVVNSTSPAETSAVTVDEAVIEGASSSEEAVSEYYGGIAESDLSRMWAIIDPELKEGVKRSLWDACIAEQFEGLSIDSIEYDETETYSEDGSLFSTGSGTIESIGEKVSQPITFEVVEREGGWFAVRPVVAGDPESCLTKSAG